MSDLTAPITGPHAISEPIVEHVVDLRQRYGWGSRKIRKLTAWRSSARHQLAGRSIVIFERHDLITKKRRRSGKPGHPGKPLTPMDEPNAVWTVDFKGQFKMLNGRYCYPLTEALPEATRGRSRIRATSRHDSSARTVASAGTQTACPSADSSLAMKSASRRLTTVSSRSTSDPSG